MKKAESQMPSMIYFQDNNTKSIVQKSQTSKPFEVKKRPQSPINVKEQYNLLDYTMAKESMNAQESTIKRKNSQPDSDAYNEFKSDDLYNTQNSKFKVRLSNFP